MKTNIFTLFIALVLSSLLQVQAQDSASCNPGFSVWSNGGLVTFRAYDSLPGIRHGWSFGDGGGFGPTAYGVNVQHQYAASGTYTVYHFITDTAGGVCHDTAAQTINVDVPSACAITIGVLRDSLQSPGRYRFYATPAGDTLRWYINNSYIKMGDTLTAYFVSGTYTICAYRHTTDGCTSSACTTVYVPDSTRTDTTRSDTTHTPACPLSIGETIDSTHTPFKYGFYAAPAGDTVRWYINNYYAGTGDSLLNRTFSPGNYVICAYRHTPDSCVSSTCISLNVADTTGMDSTVTDTTHLPPPPPPPTDSLGRNSQISAYPNPAPGETNLDLQLEENNTIQIQVFNSMGHLMLSRKVAGVRGLNHITLPVAGLPKGIYYVQVEYGGVKKRSRIQKL